MSGKNYFLDTNIIFYDPGRHLTSATITLQQQQNRKQTNLKQANYFSILDFWRPVKHQLKVQIILCIIFDTVILWGINYRNICCYSEGSMGEAVW